MTTQASPTRDSFVTSYNPSHDVTEYNRAISLFNQALQEEEQTLAPLMGYLRDPETISNLQKRSKIVKEHQDLPPSYLPSSPKIITPSQRLTDAHLVFFRADPFDTESSLNSTVRPMICIFPGNPALVTCDKVQQFFCSDVFNYRAAISTWSSNHPLAQLKQNQDLAINLTTGFSMPDHFFVVHPYDLNVTLNRRDDLYLSDFSNGNRAQFYQKHELPLFAE